MTDAANREVSGHSTVLATYGSFRVSVEPTSYVVQAGKPARVKVTAQDYDSKPVQTQVHIAAALEKWDSVTHQRTETRRGQQRCNDRRRRNRAGRSAARAAAATLK